MNDNTLSKVTSSCESINSNSVFYCYLVSSWIVSFYKSTLTDFNCSELCLIPFNLLFNYICWFWFINCWIKGGDVSYASLYLLVVTCSWSIEYLYRLYASMYFSLLKYRHATKNNLTLFPKYSHASNLRNNDNSLLNRSSSDIYLNIDK